MSVSRFAWRSALRPGLVFVAAIGVAACTETRSPAGMGLEAADPALARRAHYDPVVAGFTPYRPVGPADWRRSNQNVAPSGPQAR